MASITWSQSISGVGVAIQPRAIIRSGSGTIAIDDATLEAAEAGVLTTRSTDTTGNITMDAGGHTIATADVVDIYWTGGVQYGVTVGSVVTTDVPISGGSGDVLPSSSTAVLVVRQLSVNVSIDGDNTGLLSIMVKSTTNTLSTAAHIQLQDSGAAEIAEIDLASNVPQVWDITGGSANPFTGNPITVAKVSQANATAAATELYTLLIAGVQDASP